MSLFDTINSGGTQLLGVAWPTVWALVRILVVAVVILLCVAYLILWERKLIGWMHVRLARTASARQVCCSRSPTC